MALNTNAQQVIRAFQVAEGRLPTQEELNSLQNNSSLSSFIRANVDLKQNSLTHEQFVRGLYENAGITADDEGVLYWTSLIRGTETGQTLDRAQVIEHFQFAAAQNHPTSDVGTAVARAETAGLNGDNLQFRDPNQGEDGDGEGPSDFDGTIKFNTSADDRDGSAANQGAAESGGHTIFNIGMNELVGNGNAMANTTTTADYTFVVKDQLGHQGVYQGLFLSPVIAPTIERDASEAVLRVRVADRLAPADNVETTLDSVSVPFFTFFLNGDVVRVESEAMAAARNYDDLFAAVKAEVERMQEAGQLTPNLSVTLGDTFTEDRYVRNPDGTRTQEGEVVGKEIVINTTAGELQEGTIQVISASGRGIDPVGYGLDTFTAGGSTETIETNLTLNNVGYGSQGGSINLTGQSQSGKGIEKFNIEASNGVWLTNIMSATRTETTAGNVHLREIDLKGQGSFRVGKQDGEHIDLGQTLDSGVLYNVYDFNASSFSGVVELNAFIDGAGTINQAVNYNLNTSGNNILNLKVDGASALSQENAALNINMGSGANTVIVEVSQSVATGADRAANHKDGTNLKITTGGGADYVEVKGTGQFYVSTGAGNDLVWINGEGAGNGGEVNVGSTTGAVVNNTVLYKAEAVVSFAGFEARANIPTNANGNFIATQWMINAAIKEAIAKDPVLSKLLEVEDQAGGQIKISGLTDGVQQISVNIDQPLINDDDTVDGSVQPNANDLEALKKGLLQLDATINSTEVDTVAKVNGVVNGQNDNINTTVGTLGDSLTSAAQMGTAADGSENNSVINAGAGNNVISLSSTDDSNNVIKITSASTANKLNILNFDQGANGDVLDFSQWLNATHDRSTNADDTLSTIRVDAVLTTGAGALTGTTDEAPNAVTVLSFNSLVDTAGDNAELLASGTEFSSTITTTDLAKALNEWTANNFADDFASNHVFLIHNGALGATVTGEGAGQYLAVYAETAADSSTLTGTTVIGVLDFGTGSNNEHSTAAWDSANFA